MTYLVDKIRIVYVVITLTLIVEGKVLFQKSVTFFKCMRKYAKGRGLHHTWMTCKSTEGVIKVTKKVSILTNGIGVR